MKLFNVKHIDKLFELIDTCKGKVELISKEGDCLNLKSKLTQFLSLARIFSNEELLNELELKVYNQEDVQKLMDFMLNEK